MVLAGQAPTVAHSAIVYGAIVLTAAVSYVTLLLGERLVALLGTTGIRVLTRIMGLLLAAERLVDKRRDHAAIVQRHARAVGVEDPGDVGT